MKCLYAQEKLGIENGTCKATILIETLPAAFQMDEILSQIKRSYCWFELWSMGLYI